MGPRPTDPVGQTAARAARAAQIRKKPQQLSSATHSLPVANLACLSQLGVPTFHRTTEPTLLKRQERLIEVLVGFLEDREDNSRT